MGRAVRAFSLLVAIAVMTAPLWAFPEYLDVYLTDPLRNTERNGCDVCHVDPNGGGPRNEFGAAFSSAGLYVTPMLRTEFRDLFVYPRFELGEGAWIHFADADNRYVVVEFGGKRHLVDARTSTVDGAAAEAR